MSDKELIEVYREIIKAQRTIIEELQKLVILSSRGADQ